MQKHFLTKSISNADVYMPFWGKNTPSARVQTYLVHRKTPKQRLSRHICALKSTFARLHTIVCNRKSAYTRLSMLVFIHKSEFARLSRIVCNCKSAYARLHWLICFFVSEKRVQRRVSKKCKELIILIFSNFKHFSKIIGKLIELF